MAKIILPDTDNKKVTNKEITIGFEEFKRMSDKISNAYSLMIERIRPEMGSDEYAILDDLRLATKMLALMVLRGEINDIPGE